MDYTELEVEKILWHTLCEILGTPLATNTSKKRYTQWSLNNAQAKSIVSLYPATKYQPWRKKSKQQLLME